MSDPRKTMFGSQIRSMAQGGMSFEEIAAELGTDEGFVRMIIADTPVGAGALRKVARQQTEELEEDVSEAEAREMAGIVKNIARDEEAPIYARLSAAKYVHGVKRGYHKSHVDSALSKGDLLLAINDVYRNAAKKSRESLGIVMEAEEVKGESNQPTSPEPQHALPQATEAQPVA